MKSISVFAPATVANLIVGFDTLGVALADVDGSLFGDVVTLESAQKQSVQVRGLYAHKLPKDPKRNLVTSCCHTFHEMVLEKGQKVRPFLLTLEKNLPVCSGLGSSAASIVAALVALNTFYKDALSPEELMLLAGQMEGVVSGTPHYDNIAPALLGGLQLMQPGGSCVPLPFFENWLLVLYHPGIKISTRMARDILPKNLPRGAVIPYWQKLAGFIRGLYTGDQALAESLLYDDVIEPYRANLIPRFEEGKKAAREAGAVAFGIAGSGPTCFAIVHSMDKAAAVQSALVREMKGTHDSFSKICTLSPQGARVLKET